MQQYDLLSRFSVHFEQPRAVIISYSSCGMCPGWVNRIDADRVPDAAAGLCGGRARALALALRAQLVPCARLNASTTTAVTTSKYGWCDPFHRPELRRRDAVLWARDVSRHKARGSGFGSEVGRRCWVR